MVQKKMESSKLKDDKDEKEVNSLEEELKDKVEDTLGDAQRLDLAKASEERLAPLTYQAPDPKAPKEKKFDENGEEIASEGIASDDNGVPAYDPPQGLKDVLEKDAGSENDEHYY